MPPKKANQASKKTEQKAKARTIDDKTFGLKNKKGSKQQKYVEQVSKQVMSGGRDYAKDMERKKAQENKKRKEAELAEMELLFGKALPVKKKGGTFADFGSVDPKEKAKKADLYNDSRDEKKDMSSWTEEELRAAIEQKHGSANKKIKNAATTTDKICNSFLEAVENMRYGWFWNCPNGDKCKYRHCLPEGYVLKRDAKKLKDAEESNKISLEDLIERERAALGVGTKITLETFNIWKKKKRDEKKKKAEKEIKKKKGKAKAGNTGGLTGRELFQYNADMGGDDEEAEDIVREKMDEDDETIVHDVNLDVNHVLARSAGAVPTEAETLNSDRFAHIDASAGSAPPPPVAESGKDKVEVDEDLFGDEDIDLGDIDEQLGDLAIEEAGMS